MTETGREDTQVPSIFHCLCGFAIGNPAEFGDHLREVFTPSDDVGMDGKVHDEANHKWLCDAGNPPQEEFLCLCGFAAGNAADLDDHFLLAFTPPDGIGQDGRTHGLQVAAALEDNEDES